MPVNLPATGKKVEIARQMCPTSDYDRTELSGRQMEAIIHTNSPQGCSNQPLRIGPIIREAVLLPRNYPQHFWRLLALPVTLTTLVYLGEYWLLRDAPRPIGILMHLPHLLIFSFFAVACHRSILIGKHSVSRFGIPGWPHREFRFFGWLIFIYTIGIMLLFIVSEVVIQFIDFIEPFLGGGFNELSIRLLGLNLSLFPWALLWLILLGYLIGRLSLLLPAIAVDAQVSLRSAWLQSKGNGWRVALLVGWIPTLLLLLEKTLSFYINWRLGNQLTSYSLGVYVGIFSASEALIRYVLFTIEVALLSLLFLKLSGWHTNLPPKHNF